MTFLEGSYQEGRWREVVGVGYIAFVKPLMDADEQRYALLI